MGTKNSIPYLFNLLICHMRGMKDPHEKIFWKKCHSKIKVGGINKSVTKMIGLRGCLFLLLFSFLFRQNLVRPCEKFTIF